MKFLTKQLDFLKNGSGIHIKKENRGKFTDYCGGKVTSECIAKGKNSSNPAIRKRATFAANARKWKHQWGGNLNIRTQEEVDAINNREKEMAKQYILHSTPTLSNIYNGLVHAYNGWVEPQTTYITGQAPMGGGSKNPGKIVKSVSRAKNTGLPITKKVDTNIKNTATYLTGDNRFVNSGRFKVNREQRERAQYMITNHYSDSQWGKDLLKYFKNREKIKARGGNYNKLNQQINDVLDDFIWNSGYFKKGGAIKADEGTKLNLWKSIGNIAKSDFGQQAISFGLGKLSNKLFGQDTSNEQEISTSALDKQYELQKSLIPILISNNTTNNLQDPNNPNAYAGVPQEIFKQRQADLMAAQLKDQYNNQKKQIDLYNQQVKNQKSAEQFGQFVNTGLDLVNTALNYKKA